MIGAMCSLTVGKCNCHGGWGLGRAAGRVPTPRGYPVPSPSPLASLPIPSMNQHESVKLGLLTIATEIYHSSHEMSRQRTRIVQSVYYLWPRIIGTGGLT